MEALLSQLLCNSQQCTDFPLSQNAGPTQESCLDIHDGCGCIFPPDQLLLWQIIPTVHRRLSESLCLTHIHTYINEYARTHTERERAFITEQ